MKKKSCPKEGCSYEVVYTAKRGEANRLISTVSKGAAWYQAVALVHDDGAPISAGEGCAAVDEHTVRCSADGTISLAAELGDGDDAATVDFAQLIGGGSGDDRLTAERGSLSGGPGRDVLTATGEYVTFVDDDGAHPAADRYVGSSPSSSWLSYAGRRKAIRIDLGAGTAGEDTFSGVTRALGGSGDDLLIGTDGRDSLDGGPGSDHLVGLGGNDQLTGQTGEPAPAIVHDRLDGGAGDDSLLATGGSRFDCGTGADLASVFGPGTLVRASCERISSLGAPVLQLRPEDPAFAAFDGCLCRHITYMARASGKVVARASVGGDNVDLRLNATGRRLLAREGRLVVSLSIRTHLHSGKLETGNLRLEILSGSHSGPAT